MLLAWDPREQKTRSLCKSSAIADEFNYIFRCEVLKVERNLYKSKKNTYVTKYAIFPTPYFIDSFKR